MSWRKVDSVLAQRGEGGPQTRFKYVEVEFSDFDPASVRVRQDMARVRLTRDDGDLQVVHLRSKDILAIEETS